MNWKSIAIIPVFGLLLLPVVFIPFLNPLFEWQFQRHDIYSNLEIPQSEAKLEFQNVLSTLTSPFSETQLNSEFFSTEDILHMQDVRHVFQILYIAIVISTIIGLISILIFKSVSKLAWQVVFAISLKNLVVSFKYLVFGLIALTIPIAIWWQEAFTFFHKLVFPMNNYWQLDPATSNLIEFLPEEIFQELGIIWLAVIMAQYLLLLRVKNLIYDKQQLRQTPHKL